MSTAPTIVIEVAEQADVPKKIKLNSRSRIKMFWYLILVAMAFWTLYYKWKRRRIYKLSKEVPDNGFTKWPIIGHAHFFAGSDVDRMNFLNNLGKASVKQGGMCILWMANKLYLVITDPVDADVILKSCPDKDDTTMKYMRCVLGNGSIFAPVNIWRPRRKILAPVFSVKNLNGFVGVFAKQSAIMMNHLEKEVDKGDFSFWKYISTFTFDAVCKTALDVDLNSQGTPDHPFLVAFDVLLHLVSQRFTSPWLYLDCIYKRLGRYKTFSKSIDVLNQFVDELIRKKRKEMAERDSNGINQNDPDEESMRSFLEMVIDSSGVANGYSELELREEVLVIILAGTDTSAVGAAYTAVMLSRHPEVQEKVYQELHGIFGNTECPATAQDLPRMKYLEAVIKETLRLYPPVPVITREAFKDVELPSGKTLVDGVAIVLNIWGTHRNPVYWGDDVEQFRPERFLEPLKHPGQFMPFSNSIRNCLGSAYAMMSMKTVLSTLVRRYRLLPPSDLEPGQWTEPLRVKFDIMMKHVDNYVIRIEDRKKVSIPANHV